jgi:uncharacterized protein (DUF433 family)
MRQLQYWRKRPDALLEPELRDGQRVFYSFRDVIALRTFVYLREELPLQRIRRAVANLRELGSVDHLSEYRLYVSGSSIVWAEDEHLIDLVERPGQFRLKATMREVLDPFTNMRGDQVVALLRPRPQVSVDPEVRGGYPTVAETRIPYDVVADLVADGVRPAQVSAFYPSVPASAAEDAYDFYVYVEGFRGNDVAAAAIE